jgi:uncharacterized protein (TIRG00374 family)
VRRIRPPVWLTRGVGLVIFALVVEYLVLPQLAGARKALHLLVRVHPGYVVVGIALEVLSLCAYAALTRVVLPRTGRPSWWTLLRIDVTSLGVSHVVPGGSATAAALRLRLLISAGVRAPDALIGITVQGIGSAVVLNVMLLIGLLVTIAIQGANLLYALGALLGVLLLLGAGAMVFALTFGREGSIRFVRAAATHLPVVTPDMAERALRKVAEQLRILGSDRERLTAAICWATVNWLLDAASLWVFVLAFGHLTTPGGLLVAFGLANVVAVLPITPGGLGVVEGVLVPTLVGFGTPRGIAILGVVSYRLVNFWLPIPASALTYLSLRAGVLRHEHPGNRPWRLPHVLAAARGARHWFGGHVTDESVPDELPAADETAKE